MDYNTAKTDFIAEWGVLGSAWGINKTEAQIHALLLLAHEALSVEDIMAELHVSRGNVSMSLRSLMDWGLVYKRFKPNERKDFFEAEKEVWTIASRVMQERQKRELQPILRMLDRVSHLPADATPKPQVSTFRKVSSDIREFATLSDGLLTRFARAERSWIMTRLLKLLS